MISIMFWNTYNKKDINNILCEAIIENDCGLVILPEYKDNLEELCFKLSLKYKDYEILPNIACDRIEEAIREKELDLFKDNYYD